MIGRICYTAKALRLHLVELKFLIWLDAMEIKSCFWYTLLPSINNISIKEKTTIHCIEIDIIPEMELDQLAVGIKR